ncbi:hypothetical protein D3Z52_08590 [Clostridiaceae bacterium]|nr:hypothetical protein [Clostridiaceae bacterium]NBI83496.1 hypothetical protein [Clostridiaceae bacterium]
MLKTLISIIIIRCAAERKLKFSRRRKFFLGGVNFCVHKNDTVKFSFNSENAIIINVAGGRTASGTAKNEKGAILSCV